jgi:hypothetical protein
MKRKSLTIVLFVAVALAFTLTPVKSFALQGGWHFAKIVYAGPLFDKIIIKVDSSPNNPIQFQNQWLVLNSAMQNSLLATALSGLSMQQPVRIWIANDPSVLAGITVQTCYSVLLIE